MIERKRSRLEGNPEREAAGWLRSWTIAPAAGQHTKISRPPG
jgi:hypothetical protein